MRRSRAIGLLFVGIACGAGCVLDLDGRGAIVISTRSPADADRVTGRISAGSRMLEVELGERTELGVPAGPVTIAAEALRGSDVIGDDQETVEVAAGATVEVMLDLIRTVTTDGGVSDDAGVPEVRSAPIEAIIRVREDQIAAGVLSGESDSNEGAYLAFLNDAEDELGPGATISVAAVSLQLLTSNNVAFLEDLWDQTVTVALVREDGTGLAEIASGDPPTGSTQAELMAIGGADLSAVAAGLENGRFLVEIRGPTPRSSGSDFDEEVRVAVSYVAR